mmetsp:Transcript_82171/g.266287  ORF Transcript_82171/g.266287 Transcript_82171/m.266287 type:complete len:236 (-) Transcript_82171:677-1384(-)
MDAVVFDGLPHGLLLHQRHEFSFVQRVVPVSVGTDELRAQEGCEPMAQDVLFDPHLLLLVRRCRHHRLGGHGREEAEHRPRHQRYEEHEEEPVQWVTGNHGHGDPGPVIRCGQLKESEQRRRDVGEHCLDLLRDRPILGPCQEAMSYQAREHNGQREALKKYDGQDPREGAQHLPQQLHALVERSMHAHDANDSQQPREHEAAPEQEACRGRRGIPGLNRVFGPIDAPPVRGHSG